MKKTFLSIMSALLALFSLPGDEPAGILTAAKPGDSVETALPAQQIPSGTQVLLKGKLFGYAATPAGCNYGALLFLNGKPVTALRPDGTPRLRNGGSIGLVRKGQKPLALKRFQGNKFLTVFAPDAKTADTMTVDGNGASVVLDVTDLVRADGENILKITNVRTGKTVRMDVVGERFELSSATPAATGGNPLLALPLKDAVKLPDVVIKEVQSEKEFDFPAMPAQAGFVPVLRCRMVSYGATPSGCNYNARIRVNGQPLTRYTAGDTERLIGRNSTFGLKMDGGKVREFPIFAGDNLMTIFAPTAAAGDSATTDQMGATFLFDLSDRVRGVDGNSIVFRNIRARGAKRPDLIVTAIEIGYLDAKNLPKPPSMVPARGAVKDAVQDGKLTLRQGEKGGFTLQSASGLELRCELLLGMTHHAPVQFRAEDAGASIPAIHLGGSRGKRGFVLNAKWRNGLELQRTLTLQDGRLVWKEFWSNRGTTMVGVPFRHRFWIEKKEVKFFLAGDGDSGAKLAAGQNPTIFLADKKSGNGFGISAENDWTRLLTGMRAASGVADFYTTQLGLEPGKSIELEFAVDPEDGGQSYWGFINRLRRRYLGEKTLTAPAPYFWNSGFRRTPGADDSEKIRNSFAHLGPAVVAYPRWSRLSYDAPAVVSGTFPKLPDGKPDIEKFVSFAHREPFYAEFQELQKKFAAAAPEAKLIAITHPAMEIAYAPEAERWPYAADAIRTVRGGVFNDSHYSRAYVGAERAKEGWAVYYYVPRPGGKYAAMLLNDTARYLRTMNASGIYFDEFSFSGSTRGYSRYDYSRSDGYSADLDASGKVLRFKSDNAMTSAPVQKALVELAAGQGKLFYGNGGPALRSLQTIPALFFIEGGNGYGALGAGHLTQVPMALGNFGDFKSRKGVFEAARSALSAGMVYSPHGMCMLFLEGRDNFVSRMYPITIQEIGAGIIKGRERLISIHSGTIDWNVPDGPVTLYCYQPSGDLAAKTAAAVADRRISLTVPPGGMVIAER